MTGFALAVPFEAEQELVADAARYGHTILARCSGADELASRIRASRPEAALVAALPQYLSPALVAICDAEGVPLVVIASAADQLRHAQDTGIVDALTGPLSWATLMPDAAAPAPDPSPPGAPALDPAAGSRPAPARRGRVITVWGSPGSPGRTSVAIAIAAELADAGLRVALGDADTHAASVGPALGLLDEAPGFAAACRLASTGALSDAEFGRLARWVGSGRTGFWVLTGIGRPDRWPEITEQRVEGVLAAAREWVDVLVVDAASSLERDEEVVSDAGPPRRNAATIAALRGADQVIAVGAADPIGLSRYLRSHAELVEAVAPAHLTTVITKVRSSAIGLNPQGQVAQTLARFGGISDPVLVPWDPGGFDAAVLGGTPLRDAAPRSPARLAIRALVRERLLAGAASRRRPGRGRRSASPAPHSV
ncbi:MAG: regulator [Microbacteriaceae bacterium]|nr:regulator [Microbacteriaceae bacterium]